MHSKYRPQHLRAASPPGNRSTETPSGDQPSGRHRTPPAAGYRRRISSLLGTPPARFTLAAGLSCCLGVVILAESRSDPAPAPGPASSGVVVDRAAADQAAARSRDRAVVPARPTAEPAPSPTPSATPTPTAAPKTTAASPAPKKPVRPRPVAGLTQAQMDNAKIIVDVGGKLNIPRKGLIVAVATAMQESNLYNLASGALPESQNYANQGLGWDHDSVGLFQQRTSTGWGTVADLMRPAYAAERFYEALLQVPGWQQDSMSAAAQAVQVSAFADAYAQHEERATTIVDALR